MNISNIDDVIETLSEEIEYLDYLYIRCINHNKMKWAKYIDSLIDWKRDIYDDARESRDCDISHYNYTRTIGRKK